MNYISLIGRTTDDITLRQTQSGNMVANFSLAVKRPYKKDTTDFFNVIAWNKQAEVLSQYVKKGNEVGISGHLENRSYEKDGQKRYITEVVVEKVHLLSGAPKQDEQEDQAPSETSNDYEGFTSMAPASIADDDLPW